MSTPAGDAFEAAMAQEFPSTTGLSFDLEAILRTDTVRLDCSFCGWERSAKDDNHAPECAYWTFFGPGVGL